MSKKIVLMKPAGEIKSYAICLVDEAEKTVAPLLFLKQSTLITEEQYHEIVGELKISTRPDYLPNLEIGEKE